MFDFKRNRFFAVGILLTLWLTALGQVSYADTGKHCLTLADQQTFLSQHFVSDNDREESGDRYEIGVDRLGDFTLLQQFSGTGFTGIKPQSILISTKRNSLFTTASFYSSDQRQLIFQYLYPSFFFF